MTKFISASLILCSLIFKLSKSAEWSCYEQESCSQTDFAFIDSIDCGGYLSCGGSSISQTQDVKCNGYGACAQSTVTGDGSETVNVECGGFKSCDDLELGSGVDKIECNGPVSCVNIKDSLTDIDSVECEGTYSCRNQALENDKAVDCIGHSSCIKSDINNVNNLQCGSYFGCAKASISNVDTLQCDGIRGCSNAEITNVKTIIANGVYAIGGAEISSGGLSSMTVEIAGFRAASNAVITCEDGSTCNIVCNDERACQGLKLIEKSDGDIDLTYNNRKEGCDYNEPDAETPDLRNVVDVVDVVDAEISNSEKNVKLGDVMNKIKGGVGSNGTETVLFVVLAVVAVAAVCTGLGCCVLCVCFASKDEFKITSCAKSGELCTNYTMIPDSDDITPIAADSDVNTLDTLDTYLNGTETTQYERIEDIIVEKHGKTKATLLKSSNYGSMRSYSDSTGYSSDKYANNACEVNNEVKDVSRKPAMMDFGHTGYLSNGIETSMMPVNDLSSVAASVASCVASDNDGKDGRKRARWFKAVLAIYTLLVLGIIIYFFVTDEAGNDSHNNATTNNSHSNNKKHNIISHSSGYLIDSNFFQKELAIPEADYSEVGLIAGDSNPNPKFLSTFESGDYSGGARDPNLEAWITSLANGNDANKNRPPPPPHVNNSLECLDNQECAHMSENETPYGFVQCFGYESCAYSEILAITTTCNGELGCLGATFVSRDRTPYSRVVCGGRRACQGTLIENAMNHKVDKLNVYCSGDRGCVRMVSNERETDFECYGRYSCADSRLKGRSIIATGYGALQDAKIDVDYLECNGIDACKDSNIVVSDDDGHAVEIYCIGDGSCNSVAITGETDEENSMNGNVTFVGAYGANSLESGTIDSITMSILEVALIGYQSGKGLMITCRQGSNCYISCLSSTACEETVIVVEYGAGYEIGCDEDCFECPAVIQQTQEPSIHPTQVPTQATNEPTAATDAPTGPSLPPTLPPTMQPTEVPTPKPVQSGGSSGKGTNGNEGAFSTTTALYSSTSGEDRQGLNAATTPIPSTPAPTSNHSSNHNHNGGACFSVDSVVTRLDLSDFDEYGGYSEERVGINEIGVGDVVLSGMDGEYSEVMMLAHFDAMDGRDEEELMRRICSHGGNCIELTYDHLLYVRKGGDSGDMVEYFASRDVNLGDFMLDGIANEWVEVVEIEENVVSKKRSVLTSNGKILINNIVASCYFGENMIDHYVMDFMFQNFYGLFVKIGFVETLLSDINVNIAVRSWLYHYVAMPLVYLSNIVYNMVSGVSCDSNGIAMIAKNLINECVSFM